MTAARRIPALVIAGVSSGVGKTTVTLGILEALRRRGLVAQAFKVGPDFIDPAFHALATGRASYSLDGWMCGREHVAATVARHAADADLALIEGVMGCFDGLEGASEAGSTAEIAKWLGAPVGLVVDAGAMVRSAAAVVLGFERFDPDLELAGVIWNRVGGPAHRRWLEEAVADCCKTRVVGALPRDPAVVLPERHLGLVTAAEGGYSADLRRRLAELVEAHVDIDTLLSSARSRIEPRRATEPSTALHSARAVIGVARDEAFQFYYPENLERLERAGARLVFWSPLRDRVPPEADGLYLGGGYPELHGRALSENRSMRQAMRRFAESGRPVYAECGGLMYLAESLIDADGAAWPMVGVLPATVTMERQRLRIGYREVEITTASPLGPAGTRARGHEFHCSALGPVPASIPRAYLVGDGRTSSRPEGFAVGRTLMSYVHLHFGSNPAMAANFVSACATRC
ncbi:MAG TPA: cobyrinate a,c-diamide synthase [Methylomirabilota bacterium]|jgi:cobyrinic acid a,c-diamide synthase|nr:cobyrinate a,c-diamide synthase [Methylomirabilota bacterium]